MNPKLKNVILVVIIFIGVIAYLDQTPFFLKDREHVIRSLWWVGLAVISIVYYIFRQDKSEALAIFSVGFIELMAGLEDFIYFVIFKLQGKTLDFCVNPNLNNWFTANIADKFILHNSCTTFEGLFINSIIIGGILSYLTFNYLVKKM